MVHPDEREPGRIGPHLPSVISPVIFEIKILPREAISRMSQKVALTLYLASTALGLASCVSPPETQPPQTPAIITPAPTRAPQAGPTLEVQKPTPHPEPELTLTPDKLKPVVAKNFAPDEIPSNIKDAAATYSGGGRISQIIGIQAVDNPQNPSETTSFYFVETVKQDNTNENFVMFRDEQGYHLARFKSLVTQDASDGSIHIEYITGQRQTFLDFALPAKFTRQLNESDTQYIKRITDALNNYREILNITFTNPYSGKTVNYRLSDFDPNIFESVKSFLAGIIKTADYSVVYAQEPPTLIPSTPKPIDISVPPTATPVPPTETLPPPTVTPVPPTATFVSPSPTATPVPPTATRPPERPVSLFPEPRELVYPEAYLNPVGPNSRFYPSIYADGKKQAVAPMPPKEGLTAIAVVGNVLEVNPDGTIIVGGQMVTGKEIQMKLRISNNVQYLIVVGTGGTWSWVSPWPRGNLGNIAEIKEKGGRVELGLYWSDTRRKQNIDEYNSQAAKGNIIIFDLSDLDVVTAVVAKNALFAGYN